MATRSASEELDRSRRSTSGRWPTRRHLDVAFPVIARQEGTTAGAGLPLSALTLGLGVTSLVYGRRHSDRTAVARHALIVPAAYPVSAPDDPATHP